MAKKRNRTKRKKELSKADVRQRLNKYARKHGVKVLDRVGVNIHTVNEAMELVDEAAKFMKAGNGFITYSSAPDSGIYLTIARK
jgi:hypothetical protein